MSAGVAGQAHAQTRLGTVDVSIALPSPDFAHVRQLYVLAPSLAPLELRVLTRPCATIENIQIERAGIALTAAQSREGPWIILRDSTASVTDSTLDVSYEVRMNGTGMIPLVHLAAPLARNESARLGAVSVAVRFADNAGRVAFPHMTRQAPTEWSARYVAVPSFVEVAGTDLTTCNERGEERGDNGGLVWRFFLLVGIMVAWVPLYLAWARRSGDNS